MPSPPTLSVATVIERNAAFLFMEETVKSRLVINQPAGRLDAAVREAREATGWDIEPLGLVGIYR